MENERTGLTFPPFKAEEYQQLPENTEQQVDAQPNADIHVTIDQKQPGNLMKRVKAGLVLGGLTLAAWGGYQVWQMLHGQNAAHQYSTEVEQKETRVYKSVYLNLAEIESEFHIRQETTLDRADDAFIDWNPIDFNTLIDSDITTEVHSGIVVDRLEAARDNIAKTLTVVIDGELTTTTPAVDWDSNRLDVEMRRFSVGVGPGELNKARHSAEQLIQASGGIAAACALRDNDVQEVLGQSIEDFLASTSFSDGIEPENIQVTINEVDAIADKVYDQSLSEYRKTVAKIRKRYDGKSSTFKVKNRNLTNCDRHKITIVKNKATKK